MARTALVTGAASLLLGVLYTRFDNGGVSLLMVLWLVLILPVMLMVSAWTNAAGRVGALLGNILIGGTLWFGNLLLLFLPTALGA